MFYSTKEKILLFLLAISGVVSLIVFFKYKSLAFPEYNIQFQITKQQAENKSIDFLKALNLKLGNYQKVTTFNTDDTTKTYLEKEVGVTKTAHISEEIGLWYFTTRFFQPGQETEYNVSYSPEGKLTGFQISIPEQAIGKSLTQDQSLVKAEDFLQDQYHLQLNQWTLVDKQSKTLPHRTDHYFTWEKQNYTLKDATYRLDIVVQGDQIGSLSRYLKIPDVWIRSYEEQTSQNDLAETVAFGFAFLVFGLGMLIVFISKFRSNQLQFKFPVWVSAVTVIVSFLTSINQLPIDVAQYQTTQSWNAFIATSLFANLSSSLFNGIMLFAVVTVGEAIYREVFPEQIALDKIVVSGLKTKNINKALFVGSFCGLLMFSYIVIYYILGQRIGVWVPAEINYSDIFNTYIPWVYPMFIGLSAAFLEEGIFRLFGISFLKKYLKNTWAAVLITAVSWAALHSNYPQSPWFTRGIEITFVGILFGWIFVRYGILASVAAHYIFDSLQTAAFFYTAPDAYIKFSSTFVAFIPLILAIYLLIRAYMRGSFSDIKQLINQSINLSSPEPQLPSSETSRVLPLYIPFNKIKISVLVGVAILGVVVMVGLAPMVSTDNIHNNLDRGSVLTKVQQILQSSQVNISNFNSVVTFISNADDQQAQQYVLQKTNFNELKKLYPDVIPTQLWTIRFFKPLQQQEFYVDLLPNGQLYSTEYVLPEDQAGSNLTQFQAQKLAQNYLINEKKYQINNWKIVEENSEHRVHRTDYYFEFQNTTHQIDQAFIRTHIEVLGNQVSNYYTYLKVPEDWIRLVNTYSLKDFVIVGVTTIFSGILLILVLLNFLNLLKHKKIEIKKTLLIAGVMTFSTILSFINDLPNIALEYMTSIPYSSYLLQVIIMRVLSIVLTFIVSVVVIGLFLALWKMYFGDLFTQLKLQSWKDGLISAYTTQPIIGGISVLLDYMFIKLNWFRTPISYDNPNLDQFIPAIGTITKFGTSLILVFFVGVVLLLLYKYFRTWTKVVTLISIFMLILLMEGQTSTKEYLISVIESLVLFSTLLIIMFKVIRNNFFAYLLITYIGLFLLDGLSLLDQQSTFYKINGLVLIILSFLPLAYYIWRFKIQGKE